MATLASTKNALSPSLAISASPLLLPRREGVSIYNLSLERSRRDLPSSSSSSSRMGAIFPLVWQRWDISQQQMLQLLLQEQEGEEQGEAGTCAVADAYFLEMGDNKLWFASWLDILENNQM